MAIVLPFLVNKDIEKIKKEVLEEKIKNLGIKIYDEFIKNNYTNIESIMTLLFILNVYENDLLKLYEEKPIEKMLIKLEEKVIAEIPMTNDVDIFGKIAEFEKIKPKEDFVDVYYLKDGKEVYDKFATFILNSSDFNYLLKTFTKIHEMYIQELKKRKVYSSQELKMLCENQIADDIEKVYKITGDLNGFAFLIFLLLIRFFKMILDKMSVEEFKTFFYNFYV